MCERRHGANRELPLEPEPDIDQHQDQCGDQRRDPVAEQLLRDFRADGIIAEDLVISDAQGLFQRVRHQFIGRPGGALRLIAGRQGLKGFAQHGRIRFAIFHHDDAARIGPDRAVHIRIERHGLTHGLNGDRVRLLQLHHGAAGKVDAEIEATGRQEEHRRSNQHRRHDCADQAKIHEAQIGLLGPEFE